MEYKETVRRYVCASLDNTTHYITALGNKQYMLSDKLSRGSKLEQRSAAKLLIDIYRKVTDDQRDFVVIPVDVTYSLIDESDLYPDPDTIEQVMPQ